MIILNLQSLIIFNIARSYSLHIFISFDRLCYIHTKHVCSKIVSACAVNQTIPIFTLNVDMQVL